MTDGSRRIVLHVGLPKTGTTSIQKFMAANSAALAATGVLYPTLAQFPGAGRPEAGRRHQAAETLNPHRGLLGLLGIEPPDFGRAGMDFDALCDRFHDPAGPFHTMVLSHETLGMRAARVDLDALARITRGVPLQIVVYLRHPVHWLWALYRQLVRGRSRIKRGPETIAQTRSYLQKGFLGILAPLHAWGEVVCADFGQHRRGGTLVADFLRRAGIDWQGGDPDSARISNRVDLSHEEVSFLLAANRLGVPDALNEVWQAALRRRDPVTYPPVHQHLMPRATAAAIAEMFDRERGLLQWRYGVSLQDPGPLDPDRPDGPVIGPHAAAHLRAILEPATPDQDRDTLERTLAAVRMPAPGAD